MKKLHGADIDDVAATLLLHLFYGCLGDEVSPFQVDMNIPVKIVFGTVQERFQSKYPCIIDKHIGATESFNRRVDDLFAGFSITDIAWYKGNSAVIAQCFGGGRKLFIIAAFSTTLEPFSRKPRATSRPMPLEAPVINTVFKLVVIFKYPLLVE